MHKIRIILATLLMLSVLLTGCASGRSYDFRLGTGEIFNVTLKPVKGLSLEKRRDTFVVKKMGNKILRGSFILPDQRDWVTRKVKASADKIVVDRKDEFVWSEGENYNRIIDFLYSDYSILLTSDQSPQEADKAYSALSFDVYLGNE